MNKLLFPLAILSLTLTTSCSTITKKDCSKDMKGFGLTQGRTGSPKKYTDDIRDKCDGLTPPVDLEAYEKGFYQGWAEYCLPNKAFDMGRKSDRYISFCPEENEAQFREKYLIGKHYAELKDVEDDITQKMDDIRPKINDSAAQFDDYNKLKLEIEKVRRDMQALELEGNKGSFKPLINSVNPKESKL